MGIATRDHKDFIALHAMITGEDIGAQIATGYMTKVEWTIGIRPGHGHKYAFRQWETTRYDLWIWAQLILSQCECCTCLNTICQLEDPRRQNLTDRESTKIN